MEEQGDGGEKETETEGQARSWDSSNGRAEPAAEAGDCPPELTEDGAERKRSASGQISSTLPFLPHRGRHSAEHGYPSSRSSASQSFGGDEEEEDGGEDNDNNNDDDDEEEQDEECEAPLSAAMLNIFRSIPTQMDYKGQKLAEQIFQGIILVSAIIGFIYGYITEQFGWTVYIVMAGFALSCLLTLPPWPMYRRNPLKWLPVQESGTEEKKPADRKPKRHAKS
ncbi:signal peptidase complex subunit 1 [Lathamus discolor]|uniref:signal peptidase complex subunit 1 n=1 Tax=Lathamus discolor TaxID=678569 RepID=UPI0032B6FAAD